MKNLRIAYFSDLEFPSNTVATKQIVKTADTLQSYQMNIELFIPIPWKNLKHRGARRIKDIRKYYGISDRLKITEYFPVFPMAKRLHRPASSYLMLRKLKKQKYDLIYVRNFLHLKLALANGKKTLFETYKVLVPPKTSRALIQGLNENEDFIGMIVHSELARNHWISLGANPEKITTVHNGIDDSEVPQTMNQAEARKLLSIPEEAKIVCYTGNVGKAKGVETILELAKHLPGFHFNIVGAKNRDDIRRLKQQAEKKHVDNFTLIGWLPPTKVYPYLFSADALIIPPTKKPLTEGGKTVLPIKTFMYLASGVPILAPALEDTSEILKHEENAFLLKPDAPEENAEAVKRLFGDPEKLKRIGAAARATAKKFSWENRALKIIAFAEQRLFHKNN
jgi:glycosyltransferase involved in cell wall biosynthesis